MNSRAENIKTQDMARYRLTRKKNRLNRAKDGLWYAEPTPGRAMRARTVCRLATKNLTLSAGELELGLEALGDCLPDLLAQGNLVSLGRLGTLRLEFGSEGVAEPEDFTTRHIRRPRVVFQPSKEFTRNVMRGVRYEADGLTADGLSFGSVESFREWQRGTDAAATGRQS